MSLLAVLALCAGVGAEVETLAGAVHRGELTSVGPQGVKLAAEGGETVVPLAQVLEVRLPSAAPAAAPAAEMELVLVDGTRLGGTSAAVRGSTVSFESLRLGTVTVPVNGVRSLKLAGGDSQREAWQAMVERKASKDLLVVRKGENLDFLDGVIGDVDDAAAVFLTGGDELRVRRERIYGLVFHRDGTPGKPACTAFLTGGDVLQLAQAGWDGTTWTGRLAGTGKDLTIPAEQLQRLDFSLGKVVYLSQIEPREVKYTPYFDTVWKYRRDSNLDGGPLRVGSRTYARGLCIHSKTLLRYRIGGEFRRFQAVMGIDEVVGRRGDVEVVISGDGKELFRSAVRWSDEPRTLDLDVSGVRDLEILVDFGGNLDIADHLDLADAKVVK